MRTSNKKKHLLWAVQVGAVLVGGCWLGQCWLGYEIHSLWREVLEGWNLRGGSEAVMSTVLVVVVLEAECFLPEYLRFW